MSVAGHHVPVWFDEATGPDDGDVSVWNSATGRFESAPVVGAIPDGTFLPVAGAEQAVATPVLFDGGKPWWDARNLATLQAAITAASADGGGTVRVAVPIALAGTSVVIPANVNLECVGKGELTYTGTGSALTFEGQNYGRSIVRIRRTTIGWEAADLSDTSSVGVTLKNCNWGFYDLREVQNFETGVLFWGDGTGTAYNTVANGRTNDNKRGHRYLATEVNGHANGNYIFGGAIRISNFGGTAGSRFVDLSTTGNGNTYSQVNLEGTGAEKVVEIAAVDNVFLNCRMETNPANSWHFLSTSSRNYVMGGNGLLGPADAKFLDESTLKQNVIIGGRGINIASDSNNAALTARALTSNADASYVGYNISGQRVVKILGGGQVECYLGTDAHPRVKSDVTGAADGFGGIRFGRGNVAPDTSIGRHSGNAAILATPNDLECITVGTGVILKSPDGTRYRLTVANGGALSTVAV